MKNSEHLDVDHSRDFTVEHYCELLDIAKQNYEFSRYVEISDKTDFLLWRHDIDFSINRAHRLATIERDLGVSSTYFINLHSEFYNPLERNQMHLIKVILNAGHDIGLHFDATFYEVTSEDQLDNIIPDEILLFERFFDARPVAFSFHNPTEFLLSCERESYGGLINCYSKQFKNEISYCSDSNGYWRFRRLKDVLSAAMEPMLQVLTHPVWWQETPMYPRQRVFRSVYGRASSTMEFYDSAVRDFGRNNISGSGSALNFLKPLDSRLFSDLDLLWNAGKFTLLFVELYRLLCRQIRNLCKLQIHRSFGVAYQEIDKFMRQKAIYADELQFFENVFGRSLLEISEEEKKVYLARRSYFRQLIQPLTPTSDGDAEPCCYSLCQVIEKLSAWGTNQEDIGTDGIRMLPAEVKTHDAETLDGQSSEWKQLKSRLVTVDNE